MGGETPDFRRGLIAEGYYGDDQDITGRGRAGNASAD